MPSSISSSDVAAPMAAEGVLFKRPGFVRLTASDRPGVAQPVPERDIPPLPWRRVVLAAALLCFALMAAWEWHWRDFGNTPGYRNSDGAWALQRRRIDEGEGHKTVLIGASRTLFDVQLDQWQQATGERPIQLALEGTSPMPVLEDLAADPRFTGRLLIDLSTRNVFIDQSGLRAKVVKYFHDQSPSQRSGFLLSRHLVEPHFAFYDPDFALPVVVRRQAFWPQRAALPLLGRVRKLSVMAIDRDTHLWRKVETDAGYRQQARERWLEMLKTPTPPSVDTPDKERRVREKQIGRIVAAVERLRARGVRVVFLRPPSTGPWLAAEDREIPRSLTWDVVLQRTGAPGIHFQDHPQLQSLDLPEWSHLSHADAKRYTLALAPMIQHEFARQEHAAASSSAH